MSSIWSGYSIAYAGMSAAQQSLAVTSSNLSNTNTEGYTRKRATGEELCLLNMGVSSGSGADVQSILRVRNQFLDNQYRQQNTATGYGEGKNALLADVQQVVNEFAASDGTTDNGLQQVMSEFFNSWEELAKDPSSQSVRSGVKETGDSLAGTFDQIAAQLGTWRQEMNNKVQDAVSDVNTLAGQIAGLNGQVARLETRGVEAGDLRDARDLLVDQLSALVKVTTAEQDDGMVNVYLGGAALVQGQTVRELETAGAGTAGEPLRVQWQGLGVEAELGGGSVQAYLEEADASGVEAIAAVPYAWTTDAGSVLTTLTNGLNDLLVTIATKVNELHSAGAAGTDFFVAVDSAKPLGLGNIQVNPLLEAVTNIAAATSSEAGANDVATAVSSLQSDSALFACDGIQLDLNGFYQALISWLGTAGDTASAACETQQSLLTQLESQRQSLSAVSLDEELSNMIMYQHAYGASARVMNTIDSLVGDLIAELGG